MKLIKLTKGKFAKVDDADFEHLNQFKWHVVKQGVNFYAKRGVYDKENKRNKQVRMHREIMETPKGMEVDHINRNGLDNQRHNMRNCTHSQNSMNRSKISSSSKYVGVSWSKRYSIWIAQIWANRKIIRVGSYHSEEQAARERDKAAIKYHGEFANLNFK